MNLSGILWFDYYILNINQIKPTSKETYWLVIIQLTFNFLVIFSFSVVTSSKI